MQYLGGKARSYKFVIEELNKHDRPKYLEPFVGGAWIASNYKHSNKTASDIDGDLIVLYEGLQNGWIPPNTVSEEEYKELKTAEPSPLKTFAKYGLSWGGKAWGGYARSGDRNYALNAKNSLLKKLPGLLNVKFEHKNYKDYQPENTLIYCDPPYANTTGYNSSFDTSEFWKYMRDWSYKDKNNVVIISEYTAPDDFEVIASSPRRQDIRVGKGNKEGLVVEEKLFRYRDK